jgi:hypothetical protein
MGLEHDHSSHLLGDKLLDTPTTESKDHLLYSKHEFFTVEPLSLKKIIPKSLRLIQASLPNVVT